MSKKLIEIPELHNNDYSFMEVLKGLCSIKKQQETERVRDNEKQEDKPSKSNQFISSNNE